MLIKRLFNQGLARLAAHWPKLSEKLVASFQPLESTSIPWQPVSKPLDQSKIAMVTTAGLHHNDQPPFNMNDSLGDPSFRVIDGRSIANGYTITHDYYDHRDADKDVNIVFPIARLEEMQSAGCIGALSEKHFSFMGHIDGDHVQKLVQHTAPQVVQSLKKMRVDAVLLTPAWGICHQSVGLIQHLIERAGIPTISISVNRPYTEKVKPPRSIFLRWPFGHPLGAPGDTNQQAAVLNKAFGVLYEADTPGQIVDVNWRWRRESYPPAPWLNDPSRCQ